MIRVLLVRHGHVDFSSQEFREGPRGRQWDPPLDAMGREQAERLTARLALMERPAAIHVSPFQRCRETIEPFLEVTGMRSEIVEDLGEVYVGSWEGLRFEDIVSEDEELARRPESAWRESARRTAEDGRGTGPGPVPLDGGCDDGTLRRPVEGCGPRSPRPRRTADERRT